MSRVIVLTPGRGMVFPLDYNSLCIRALGRGAQVVEGLLPADLFIAMYYSDAMESLSAWMQT